METEVKLTFTDSSGRERHVVARLGRFTMGRDTDNDLAIADSNLSRHHAEIESVRGSIQIVDCNSRNGTMVNGHPVIGAVDLFDGDVINLGGSCDLNVSLQQASTPASPRVTSVAVFATAAVALILLVAALLLAISAWHGAGSLPANGNTANSRRDKKRSDIVESGPAPSPEAGPKEVAPGTSEQDKGQLARAIKRVMSTVSNDDNAPYISEAGINDVQRKVDEYRASPELRERLRAAKLACPEISAQAQGISLKPALVMYAALAESEGNGGGNPVVSARKWRRGC